MSMIGGERLRAWENLISTMEVLRREVGRDLRESAGLSDAEFSVVANLVRAGGAGVKPSDCARGMGWEPSRLSHQLRRLEKRGLVARGVGDPADARTALVRLTPQGRRAYAKAVGPHLRAAQRWFGDALSDAHVAHLNDVLDALANHSSELAEEPRRGE